VLASGRRSGSDGRSIIPNPSRSEPNNFSFNSLLSFSSSIWTYNYPYLIVCVILNITCSETMDRLVGVSRQLIINCNHHWIVCNCKNTRFNVFSIFVCFVFLLLTMVANSVWCVGFIGKGISWRAAFSYCLTVLHAVCSAVGMIILSVHLSVRPSVCDAVHCG